MLFRIKQKTDLKKGSNECCNEVLYKKPMHKILTWEKILRAWSYSELQMIAIPFDRFLGWISSSFPNYMQTAVVVVPKLPGV